MVFLIVAMMIVHLFRAEFRAGATGTHRVRGAEVKLRLGFRARVSVGFTRSWSG